MYSLVLDCPSCEHRFGFDHEPGVFPDEITCPSCNESFPYHDFSALLICATCRSKLKVPLNFLYDNELTCPQCDAVITVNTVLTEESGQIVSADDDKPTCDLRNMLNPGDVFDKYQIITLLGRGGMAEVYLAEHVLLKELRALKLMRANVASDDPIAVKRFLREAKISHSLNHPNIVKVYDVGNDVLTGHFFIAMEYIKGKTLMDQAAVRQFSEEELKDVMLAMASALKKLAAANVVHRDIKPSNIMQDQDGVYRLMDLGIAKSEINRQAGEMTLTKEQCTIGTPSYASPEQCQSSHTVDFRSDIYSLGATIYQAASGKLPFEGATAVEIILKVLQEDPEPLKKLRPDLSDSFLELIEMMMEKDPDDRPDSLDDIITMLKTSTIIKRRKRKSFASNLQNLLNTLWPVENSPVKRMVKLFGSVMLLLVIALNAVFLYREYIVDYEMEQLIKQTQAAQKERSERRAEERAARQTLPVKTDLPDEKQTPVDEKKEAAPPVTKKETESQAQPENAMSVAPVIRPERNDPKEAEAPEESKKKEQAKESHATVVARPDFLSYANGENLKKQLDDAREKYKQFRKKTNEMQSRKARHTAKMSADDAGTYQMILQIRSLLLTHWRKRLTYLEQRNKEILAARTAAYDKEAGSKVQEGFAQQTRIRSDWGYNRGDLEYSKELQKMLKQNNVDPNLHVVDSNYSRFSGPLFFAVSSGRIQQKDKLYEILAERKADPSCLALFPNFNFRQGCEQLVEYGLPQSMLKDALDFTFTFSRVRLESTKKVVRTLFFDGAELDGNYLISAAASGDERLVLVLLAMGLDPDWRNKDGETALFKTYYSTSEEAVAIRKLLLSAGADPDIRNDAGKRARDYAHVTAFLKAWEKDDLATCRKILNAGCDPNLILNNGDPLLLDACKKQNAEAVALLLEFNADFNLKNADVRPVSPIEYLLTNFTRYTRPPSISRQKKEEYIRIIQLLVKAGADLRVEPPGYGGGKNINLLWYAARLAFFEEGQELFRFLLQYTKNFEDEHWNNIARTLVSLPHSNMLTEEVQHELIKEVLALTPEEMLYNVNLHPALLVGHPLDPERLRKVPRHLLRFRSVINFKKMRFAATTLQIAVYGEQSPEVIMALMDAGCDPYERSAFGLLAEEFTDNREIKALLRNYRNNTQK